MEIRFPLILDGATGTELQKRGYGGDVSAEQWTLEHPDVIVDIQRGYVAAGSQVLYTPSTCSGVMPRCCSSTRMPAATAALASCKLRTSAAVRDTSDVR